MPLITRHGLLVHLRLFRVSSRTFPIGTGSVIYSEGAAKENPPAKLLLCSDSGFNINKIGMSETSWLASSPAIKSESEHIKSSTIYRTGI